jgi:transcriptional regulator with XRE-family HTH domain
VENPEIRNEFGQWLRKARDDLTMRELANLAGCSHGMISDIENGHRRAGPDMVLLLLDALYIPKGRQKVIILMAARDAGWKI